MVEGTATKRKTGRRRIIERPRLTRLLDESPARIKMLVAPAGYGKTTLARQWLGGREHGHAWFSCRRSSADVAALAEGIVISVRSLVPGFGAVVLERLAATENPAHELDVLAEIMLEELEEWPRDAWLVVDDYHLIGQSPSAELFFGEVAASPTLNLLVIGRSRPAWATARRVIYGEILDVGRPALAMTDAEAHELLESVRSPASVEQLRGSGWPALLGLAALAGGFLGDEPFPTSVYDFLADELFATLTPGAKRAALAIVAMPRMDRDIARELLGEQSEAVLAEASAAGMIDLSDSGAAIEMHPLIRDFLLTKRAAASNDFTERLFQILLARTRWDDAFALVHEFLPHGLEALLRAALPELLAKSRVQTLETWLGFADELGLDGPSYEHASAELAFREGSHIEAFAAAQALARRLPDSDEMKTRVLLLAGRAAHLASLEKEALAAYRASKSLAKTQEARRKALWGEIGAAIDLELPAAEQLLAAAEAECDTFVDVVNHAMHSLMLDARRGRIGSLENARALVPRGRRIHDPLLRCSFLSGLSSTLAIAGEYDECLSVAELLLSEAHRHRLDFVRSYALAIQAMGHAGRRETNAALKLADDAITTARTHQDKHATLNCEAIRSRIYFTKGEFDSAYASLATDVAGAIPSMAAEVVASRGLALAALGRYDESLEAATEARGLSLSIEARVLVPGIEAICATGQDPAAAPDAVRRLIRSSIDSGNLDALVTVYRGVPDLFAHAPPDIIDDLAGVLRKMGDTELEGVLELFGRKHRVGSDMLSPRERDVAELLAQGLTNKEIGSRLFISPATAKLHVRHIFDKLGVHTRTEAALRLTAMRSRRGAEDEGTHAS